MVRNAAHRAASRAVAIIDVRAKSPRRHRKHISVFPIEPFVANYRVAGPSNQMIVRATDASPRHGLFVGTQQLRVTCVRRSRLRHS